MFDGTIAAAVRLAAGEQVLKGVLHMATLLSATGYREAVIALTGREVEVLDLILEGRSSKEVAQLLCLSKRTVDFHLARIYEKLNVSNRVQAIRRAAELGLVAGAMQMVS